MASSNALVGLYQADAACAVEGGGLQQHGRIWHLCASLGQGSHRRSHPAARCAGRCWCLITDRRLPLMRGHAHGDILLYWGDDRRAATTAEPLAAQDSICVDRHPRPCSHCGVASAFNRGEHTGWRECSMTTALAKGRIPRGAEQWRAPQRRFRLLFNEVNNNQAGAISVPRHQVAPVGLTEKRWGTSTPGETGGQQRRAAGRQTRIPSP